MCLPSCKPPNILQSENSERSSNWPKATQLILGGQDQKNPRLFGSKAGTSSRTLQSKCYTGALGGGGEQGFEDRKETLKSVPPALTPVPPVFTGN